jgi:hypothetical protein
LAIPLPPTETGADATFGKRWAIAAAAAALHAALGSAPLHHHLARLTTVATALRPSGRQVLVAVDVEDQMSPACRRQRPISAARPSAWAAQGRR